MKKLNGHHHISMLTKNGKNNNDFYTKILGLRRVKKPSIKIHHPCIIYFMAI